MAAQAASAAEDSNQAERARAPLHAAAAATICAKATDAAEESRRAELARAPLHAAAATAVTVAAVRQEACRDAEERVMSTLVRPQSLTLSAARVAEATQQLVSVRQLAQLDARHFGQCAAEELARVQDHAKLDSAEFARRTANDMASVQRAAELDKERLRELHAARARAEKAEFAAMAGKVEQRAADARRVHAEVRLDLVEAQSAAMQSAAKAALMDAEQRARQLNTELAAALLALHDYRTMLAPEICAVGWAYAEGKLSDFEVALLKQLGKASSGAIGREGHDSLVTAVLGLVATGSAMDGAKLLHERAPHLFPSETKLRDEYRKEPRPPMLLRDLTGLSGETLDDALREAKAHFTRAGYDGPVVCAHDSTAVKPVAECRSVVDERGEKMVQLDCFSKGPLRVPNSSDGAKQLAALLSGTEHKAVLATLMMLVPACADSKVPPFSLFLVPGGGPNTQEAEAWEEKLVARGLCHDLEVCLPRSRLINNTFISYQLLIINE